MFLFLFVCTLLKLSLKMENEESMGPATPGTSTSTLNPLLERRLVNIRERFSRSLAEAAATSTSLVNRFQHFKSETSGKSKKERKITGRPTNTYTFEVSLLPSPFVKSVAQLNLYGGAKLRKLTVNREITAADFRKELETLFPNLNNREVGFCKAGRDKRLVQLDTKLNTPAQLRKLKILNRSALYLLPLTVQVENDDSSFVSTTVAEPASTTLSPATTSTTAASPTMRLTTTATPAASIPITSTTTAVLTQTRETTTALSDTTPVTTGTITPPYTTVTTTLSDQSDLEHNLIELPVMEYIQTSTPTVQFGISTGESLEERRRLIRQQEEEYNSSLMLDKSREEEAQVKRLREEKAQKVRNQRQEELASTTEPENGITLNVRLGNRMITRRFNIWDSFKLLVSWIGSQPESAVKFTVAFTGGHSAIDSSLAYFQSPTLSEVGITQSETLNVYFSDDHDDDLEDVNTTLQDRPDTTLQNRPGSNVTNPAVIEAAQSPQETVADDNNLTLETSYEEMDIGDLYSSEQAPLRDVLFELASAIDTTARKNIANIFRDDVLDGGRRCFRKTSFNERAELSVRFTGEDGADDGGLRREFMRLSILQIQSLPIFIGPEYNKSLAFSYKEFEKKEYFVIGKMIAYFIVHGGPLPQFLSKNFYKMLVFGIDCVDLTIDDIADYQTKADLKKILQSEDDDGYNAAVQPWVEIIELAGGMIYMQKMSDKEKLVRALVHFLLKERNRGCIAQFADGLKTLGVMETMKAHPNTCKSVCLQQHHRKLHVTDIKELYTDINWSAVGSNKRRLETKSLAFFYDVVEELEESGELESLLIFLTGLSSVPTLGFQPSPSITFGHPDDLAQDATVKWPVSNTCGLTLRLPILDNYDEFAQHLKAALSVTTFTAT